MKHPLIERFGICSNKKVECIDDRNLFIKHGLTVISALSGEGKTTYIINESKKWSSQGYNILHMNFDNAPTYDSEMIEPPITAKDFDDFFEILSNNTGDSDIVILDSLKAMTSFMGKDIENNSDVYPIMTRLRQVSKKTGCSFILIHHVYKAKNVKTMPLSFYGSRAIEEQCDSGFIYSENSVTIVKNRAGLRREEIVSLENEPNILTKIKEI